MTSGIRVYDPTGVTEWINPSKNTATILGYHSYTEANDPGYINVPANHLGLGDIWVAQIPVTNKTGLPNARYQSIDDTIRWVADGDVIIIYGV